MSKKIISDGKNICSLSLLDTATPGSQLTTNQVASIFVGHTYQGDSGRLSLMNGLKFRVLGKLIEEKKGFNLVYHFLLARRPIFATN